MEIEQSASINDKSDEEIAKENDAMMAAVAGARDFPAGFRWGAASASYQVEGAWNHSDKAESIWDRLCHTRPELIKEGATGDVACDSHRLWKEDAALAEQLGLHFYRFSISWPRLLPHAPSTRVSEDGVRYYKNLIDELLRRGVEPVVTLYHWDLPQKLQDLGGWTNPLVVEWFAEYARVAFKLFGDRVKTWITLNEPIIMCDMPYTAGAMAPSIKEPDFAPHMCARYALLAHAKAWRIYDKEFRPTQKGHVSWANHLVWFEAETDEDEELANLANQLSTGRYSQPIFGSGGWPKEIVELVAANSKRQGYPKSRLPEFTKEEIEFIKGTFDFYGLNHYTSRTVARFTGTLTHEESNWIGWPLGGWAEFPATISYRPHWKAASNQWLRKNPEGLRKLLVWLKKHYGDIPILITENGYATSEMGLDDYDRIEYYDQYLEQVLLAIKEDGVNVTGYTAWTLLDNFEWLDGYNTKFGLFEVDFNDPARPRTPRRSAHFYADVIKHNSLDTPTSHLKDEL